MLMSIDSYFVDTLSLFLRLVMSYVSSFEGSLSLLLAMPWSLIVFAFVLIAPWYMCSMGFNGLILLAIRKGLTMSTTLWQCLSCLQLNKFVLIMYCVKKFAKNSLVMLDLTCKVLSPSLISSMVVAT